MKWFICVRENRETNDPSVTLLVAEQEAQIIHGFKHSWYWADETASRCPSSSQRARDKHTQRDGKNVRLAAAHQSCR